MAVMARLLLLQLALSSALAKEPIAPPRSVRAVRTSTLSVPAGRAGFSSLRMGAMAKSAVVIGAANAVGFGISVGTQWHYHLDLIGTGVFALSALLVRGVNSAQHFSAGAVTLWSVKLASFLFYRVLQMKRDARLEGLLASTSGAAGFWFVSFIWGFVVSLPHTLAAGVPAVAKTALSPASWLGLAMFCAGFTLETAADVQKWLFKNNPANAGRFCNVGVWKLCQHPNWFGNLLLWTGILVINTPTLIAATPEYTGWRRYWRVAVSILSPLFLWKLFDAQASGSIEAAAQAASKYKGMAGYQGYIDATPVLFPSLKSIMAFLKKGAVPFSD